MSRAPAPPTATSERAVRSPIERLALTSAATGPLIFAQVREDPRVELAALHPGPDERVVLIGSGGCTALSLVMAGAGEVHAVDVNPAQNHLVELKAAAVAALDRMAAIRFLGGAPAPAAERVAQYASLRTELTPYACRYWDRHARDIGRGVIEAGVSERFIRVVRWCVRHLVQSPERVGRLLACGSLEEQRELFASEWNTRRWRWLFSVLLNRFAMSRAYDPRFFAHVGRRDFAAHFRQQADHAITNVPVGDNYFLHQMLGGSYPVDHADGVPPYLGAATYPAAADRVGALRLVDGSITEYLGTLPAASVDAFGLSNVCEWLDAAQVAALFREVSRTAAPGARVVFRNFVGWTEMPRECRQGEEDRALSASLMRAERSVVQARVVVCRVRGAA